MSLISYKKLVQLVESGAIDAPLENVNGASIDIRLGNSLMIENVQTTNKPTAISLERKESVSFFEIGVPRSGYLLTPGEFILATTMETFNLPHNIAAEYKLKSSLARNGLQHLLAGWCDPGWHGSQLTLELKNVTRFNDLILTPGMKIGQIVFWECENVPSEHGYAEKGQYNNQKSVTSSKGLR